MHRSFLVSLLILWLLCAGNAAAAGEPYAGPQPEPGFLGISIRWVPAGIEILSVDTGGPADQAGLKPYDVLVGQADPLTPTILEPFGSCPPGTKRIVHVTRSGEHMTFRCTWETLSADRRQRLERGMATATGLLGQVEVVSGRKVGIRLFAPAARMARLAQAKASLQRGKEHLSALSILHGQDDWRVVAEVSEGSVAPQVNDLALFQWEQPQVATAWGPNWRPAPAPEPKTYRKTGRKIRVPRTLMDAHVALVEAHYLKILANVPASWRKVGEGTLLDVGDSSTVNACAMIDARGRRIIKMERGLSELILVLSFLLVEMEAQGFDAVVEELDRLAPHEQWGMDSFQLPRGFLAASRDPKFMERLQFYAAPMYTLVLGHELGHHVLGHIETVHDKSYVGLMLTREDEKEADTAAAAIVQRSGESKYGVLLFTAFMTRAERQRGETPWDDYTQAHDDWSVRHAYLEGVFSTF